MGGLVRDGRSRNALIYKKVSNLDEPFCRPSPAGWPRPRELAVDYGRTAILQAIPSPEAIPEGWRREQKEERCDPIAEDGARMFFSVLFINAFSFLCRLCAPGLGGVSRPLPSTDSSQV